MAFAILMFATNFPTAHAINRIMGLDALGFESDVEITAPRSFAAFDFPIPRMAQLQSATANISITANSQVNNEALFFFYFNDRLIETRTAKELRQQKNLVLKLPLDGVLRDSVQLQIRSNMFITDDVCKDLYSGGLYFTIHKNTALNLTYDMLPIRTVSDFFGSFQQALLLVVPDNAVLDEMVPAAWAYGLLKKTYPLLDIQLVRANELAKMPPVPRIWVGLGAKLPAYFKNAAPGITLVDSNTLLFSAEDLPKLRDYIKQLADLQVFSLNPTSSKRIIVTPVNTPAGKTDDAIAFGSNIIQEGILTVPANFPLYPALLQKTPAQLGLHLEGAHTVTYESERPVRMDVFLNSNLVHSSVLNQTGQFKKDILLSNSLELRARNILNVQFVYPDSQGQCLVRGKVQSAQIFPTSYMWGSGEYQANRLAWSNIGLFFGRPGTIILDESLGTNTLKVAGELVYFLNQQLPSGFFAFPDVKPLSAQGETPDSGYVLVAGLSEKIPEKLQERMPISLGKDFTVYRKATQSTLYEYQSEVNSVVGRIGENKGSPLILLSANLDSSLLVESLKFINQSKNYELLNGNVLIYKQPKRLFSFDLRDRTVKVEKQDTHGALFDYWENNRPLVLISLSVGTLLILIGLLFRQIISRRKSNKEAVRSEKAYTPFK